MIFLITYSILFILLLAGVSAFHYWTSLLTEKTTYTRLELLDPSLLLGTALKKIFPSGKTAPAGVSFLLGILLSVLFTWAGGLISPDRSDAPDFAGNELANYFFQSNIVLLLFLFGWKYLNDLAAGSSRTFLSEILSSDTAFISGAGLSFSSVGLSAWGVYHEMYFLAVLLNVVAGSVIISFILRRTASETKSDEDFENPGSPDDFDFGEDLNFSEGSDLSDDFGFSGESENDKTRKSA